MKLNRQNVTQFLDNFDFQPLFIEELGWDYPVEENPIYITVDELVYTLTPIAEKRELVVYQCLLENQPIPAATVLNKIDREINKYSREHFIIYADAEVEKKQVWQWVKREKNYPLTPRTVTYSQRKKRALLETIEAIAFQIEEEDKLNLIEVKQRTKKAFDLEKVTKKFFEQFQLEHRKLVDFIQGINDLKDASWYASVILNRLMFVYFLQKKGFIDEGNIDYLQNKLTQMKTQGKDLYYEQFLQALFFEGFAKQDYQRSEEVNQLIGKIKYLNGGLFLPHQIEVKYGKKIKISDQAFENIFSLFSGYSWHLDDTPSGNDDEINPDVLGYIFEKYINQKAFGAYYTKPEITNYLCERTINKFIHQKVNADIIVSGEWYNTNLNNNLCNQLLDDILPNLSILDPACGSGAFLVAALQHLIKIYTAIFAYIQENGDEKNKARLNNIINSHPSLEYYIKKRIITDNLYGVDIMEEATEIAKLRLFLSLVASAKTVDDLEPLPNVDFNIMAGNSLIGLIKVDGNAFSQIGEAKAIQGSLLPQLAVLEYQRILTEKNESVKKYKEHAFKAGEIEGTSQEDRLQMLKNHIETLNRESLVKLNQLLLDEFSSKLGIKYEEVQLKGKGKKRVLNIKDIEALKPFHWGYHFDEIIARGGFDIILGNPPWEVFQPDGKEFFAQHSDNISKKKMSLQAFQAEINKLLVNEEIKNAWLKYQSDFVHTREYFRFAEQYKNQVTVINGKRHGKDVNLYKLFIEQSVNLLAKNGECGLVIPSGIYTDLGAKKLREMLFNHTKITGLFCFENKKAIFEGVHKSFKFVILTFENGKETERFPAKFMRHEVAELNSFPAEDTINITVDLIKKLSPDSLSVMEFKTELDITIAKKMSKFPLLGEEIKGKWHLELHREFNMTDDAYLFKTEPATGRLPLYEGKMIHQFTHQWSKPKYWIDEAEGRKAILGKKGVDNGQILDYQCYRLAFRDVASSTNERTMIATIIPQNIFTVNTLIMANPLENQKELLIATAILNSFICDFVIRQRVTAHCNMFYVYQTPVPRLTENDQYFNEIVERAAQLICTTPEYDELAEAIGLGSHKKGVTEQVEREKIRAKIDGMVAHLYGLTEQEFKHILSTFPIVAEDIKQKTLEAYRDIVGGVKS